jgi:hypothetical protein
MTDDLGADAGNNITAMSLWSWSRVFGAPIDKVVDHRRGAGDRPAYESVHRALVRCDLPARPDARADEGFP